MFFQLRLGDTANLIKTLEAGSINAVITDPPYFIEGMGNGWNKSALEASAGRATTVGGLPVGMKFDPKQGLEFEKFMEMIARESKRVLADDGYFVSFSQPRLYHRMAIAAETAGFEIVDTITWKRPGQAKAFTQDHFIRNKVKRGQLSQAAADEILSSLSGRKTPQLRSTSELVVVARKRDAKCVRSANASVTWNGAPSSNLIETSARRKGKTKENMHMTVKPVDLIAHLIELFTKPGEVVLDPFLGSGSHGVAAVSQGRSFVGFEMVPEYYDLSLQRISTAAEESKLRFKDLSDPLQRSAPSDAA